MEQERREEEMVGVRKGRRVRGQIEERWRKRG